MVYQRIIKRGIDKLLALVALILLSPVMLLIVVAIRLESPGSALFKQERMGRNGQSFYIYKFRTMKIDTPRDVATDLLDNPEKWITPLGRFLRKSSLDELPQLWNIVKGEMAIVGPRPALVSQTNLNQLRSAQGIDVLLPGLTGWAQINGRDLLNDEQKTSYDVEYLHRLSFSFDVKCCYMTIAKVLKKEGILEGKIEE